MLLRNKLKRMRWRLDRMILSIWNPAGRSEGGVVRFSYIPVLPSRHLVADRRLTDGGPIWPSSALAESVRHYANGVPVDVRNHVKSTNKVKVVRRPCIWGGYARNHFGHVVAEHLTRVLVASVNRPDDLILMVAPIENNLKLPAYLEDVLGWYGIVGDRLKIVRRPILVRTLRVAPQAEHLPDSGPSAAYLDALDANTARNQLVPVHSPILYVGRPGLIASKKGGHAGESYLLETLQRLGVQVLDPSHTTLREQLALYAGAKVIVFAEGSAMHCRQLLGRVDQRIIVLNRRQLERIAQAFLEPRCRSVEYLEATEQSATVNGRNGEVQSPTALSFYNLDVVFDCFAELGIPLAASWDMKQYEIAKCADAVTWLNARPKRRLLNSIDGIRAVLTDQGLTELLETLEANSAAAVRRAS